MAAKGGRLPSNGVLLEQLRNGTAQFELLSTPIPMPASDVRFFARTASTFLDSRGGGVSLATKKVESYAVIKITGDGRCMFRALAKGIANHKGLELSSRQEKEEADDCCSKLSILENHLVYSLSDKKTTTMLYIMETPLEPISGALLEFPIKDVLNSSTQS
ncbi:OVARIAN TUMOR DOMAIN-containing deubiquitinating enzyme 3-like [Curcuma longa]|uniref:OVARIAN TUMOR DOMAIN-containing deubiquitinating enzyme 3-like n=1 Tax=Curcuma longa TaxID=136217 RepID=UPI003D9FAE63